MTIKLTILIAVISLFSLSSFAQLKVNSTGKVGIGLDPDAGYNLSLGSIIVKSGGTYPDLIIGNNPLNGGTKAIYPTINDNGCVGTSAKQFFEIRGRYHYAYTNLLTSDRRLKENFRSIDKPLDKLLQISGQKYDFISQGTDTIKDEKEKKKRNVLEKKQIRLCGARFTKNCARGGNLF